MISFDNTECAFAYQSTAALKKAKFLYSLIARPWIVKIVVSVVPSAIRWRFPFTRMLIRSTVFSQFVGGETLTETISVTSKLENYDVKVILDYGVEGGKNGEEGVDHAAGEFIKVIDHAATQDNVPYISIKLTGIIRMELLETVDAAMNRSAGNLMNRYSAALESLGKPDKEEWNLVRERVERICERAAFKNVAVLIDAEETWIQGPVDALTILMMKHYNKKQALVYNTLQMYRHDRIQFLQECCSIARQHEFILGTKLVRGAYMEKERERAVIMGYPSPIQSDKESTDRDFNAAILYCLDNLEYTAVMVCTHNEYSNAYTVELMQQKGIPLNSHHVHFSQLYGMSDNITFNLAKYGCSVSKYLPFGPIREVVPYLMRRAQENTSVGGQTSRELTMIKRELKRRNGL